MFDYDLARIIEDEITEGRDIKRTDREISDRIVSILYEDGYINDDE